MFLSLEYLIHFFHEIIAFSLSLSASYKRAFNLYICAFVGSVYDALFSCFNDSSNKPISIADMARCR